MTDGLKTIVYPVKNLTQSKALFTALLGVEPYADEAYYVGFRTAGQEIGLDPNGHAKGMTGPVPYWHVSDLRATLKGLLDAGAETLQDVQDVGSGKLIAFVKDADGNLVGLVQDPAA
ncbi:VOC family protein [Streptomyces sp. Tue6028]|uniref:VOC family protein n=1 Tax=Streptomyces sp. Tue6028 TaxID=2036037 RepID=UPI003EBAF341